MSMIYEALSAGCCVGIIPVDWKKQENKFQKSINYLIDKKYITTFESFILNGKMFSGIFLNEAEKCAKEILKKWYQKN